MAKRAAPDEKPYRPLLDADLVSAAISQIVPEFDASPSKATPSSPPTKVIDIPRAEPARRFERLSEVPSGERQSAQPVVERTQQAAPNLTEKFDQEKRILFTRPESQAIDRLVVALATRVNAQVKVSHVIRALVALLLNAESQVDKRAGEAGPLVRPANGDSHGLQRFEREIGNIIADALRDAGPLR